MDKEMLKGEKTMQNNEKLTTVHKIRDSKISALDAVKILEEHDKNVQAEMANKIAEMMKKLKENPLYGLVFGMTLSLSDEQFKELEEKVKAIQGENK